MTIRLSELTEASNGPGGRPVMLSVGDSLMWGQGLRPENRFREIVRQRLNQEVDSPVVELSMARSGAKLHPRRDPSVGNFDSDIHDTILNPPIAEIYSADAFTREVPNSALTTFQQLRDAHQILDEDPDGKPDEIRWILLDGGINDVGIDGILTPIPAIQDGYILSNWNTWLRDRGLEIEEEMVETLLEALELFPNAVVVVNGYFPVFSYYSIGHIIQLQSVGLLYGITNIALLQPLGLDALATASATWQAVNNKVLRRAIRTVRHRHPERAIIFARSNIEGSHCLFSPASWLWGYDAVPDDIPDSADHWVQWLASATPKDQVIDERIRRCNVLTDSTGEAISCRLASIGHPNVLGAQDYARSIIETLEEAGELSTNLHRCLLGHRRRLKVCKKFSDEWSYTCVSADATIGKACSTAVTALADTAKNQFSQARDHFEQAGDHLQQARDCFDDTSQKLQECDDTEAAEKARCNAEHQQRVDGPCNIRCNRFMRCRQRFGRFNPRRYTCLVARGVCVAVAAAARGVCIAGSVVVREICKATAWTKSAACKVAAVAEDVGCAGGEVAKGVADGVVGIAHGVAGIGVGAATGVTFIGCKVGGWIINRGCRLTNWIMGQFCKFGVAIITGICFVGAVAVAPIRLVGAVARRSQR